MPSKYEETIYGMLSREPVTPNEIVRKVGVSHKTAKDVLMHLAVTGREVKYKNSGRIRIFWKRVKG